MKPYAQEKKPYAQEKKLQIIAMLKEGVAGVEISRSLKVSNSLITSVRQANGIKKGKGGRPAKKPKVLSNPCHKLTNTGNGRYGGAF